MASKARKAFDQNCEDVDTLLEIYKDLKSPAWKDKYDWLEVLHRSAIVLVTAYWEAYCEDIAAEALQHLVKHVSEPEKLPEGFRRRIAKELRDDRHDLAVWRIAGAGWKAHLVSRLETLTLERNRRLNTPKSAEVVQLFRDAMGVEDITEAWHWSGMSVVSARKKLDDYVSLRGEIAHRGATAAGAVTSDSVKDYLKHVQKLAAKTGGHLNKQAKAFTGKPLFVKD